MRKHIGADEDAPLHLGAEALRARLAVHVEEVRVLGRAVSVANAVVAREVRRCLRRREHVIDRDAQALVGQAHLDRGRARALQLLERGEDRPRDVLREASGEVFLRQPDAQPAHAARERAGVIILGAVDRGRVARIESGHHVEHEREVLGARRERTALVERRGERDHAVARDAAVGRAQPAHAGEGRGLPDRPARVGAGRRGREARRHRGRGSAGASARHGALVPRVLHRAEIRVLVRRAHRELVHVGLAEDHRAGAVEALDHMRVVGGDEVFQHARAARRRPSRGAEEILVSDRNAGERHCVAARDACVGRARLREGLLPIDGDEGVEARIEALDPLEARRRQLDAGKTLRSQLPRQLR